MTFRLLLITFVIACAEAWFLPIRNKANNRRLTTSSWNANRNVNPTWWYKLPVTPAIPQTGRPLVPIKPTLPPKVPIGTEQWQRVRPTSGGNRGGNEIIKPKLPPKDGDKNVVPPKVPKDKDKDKPKKPETKTLSNKFNMAIDMLKKAGILTGKTVPGTIFGEAAALAWVAIKEKLGAGEKEITCSDVEGAKLTKSVIEEIMVLRIADLDSLEGKKYIEESMTKYCTGKK